VYRTAFAGVDLSLFRLSLLIGVGTLLVAERGAWHNLIKWPSHPLVAAYLLLAGVLLLSMLLHPINTFLAGRQAAQIGVGVVALATAAELARRTSVDRLVEAIVLGSFLPILAAGWQALALKFGFSGALPFLSDLPAAPGLEVTRQALSSFGPIGARAKGTFGDPNHFGVYLTFVLSLSLAQTALGLRRGSRRDQVFFGAMSTAAFATLVATYSRSAWLATLVATLICAVALAGAWRSGRLHRPRKGALIALICALALSAGVAPSVAERLEPSSSINVVSDRGHSQTVRFALRQFKAHPVLGIGPGGLGVKLREGSRTSGAHSTYLTIAAELGLVGLLALLLAITIAVRLLVTSYRSSRGTELGLLALGLGAAYAGYLAANATYDLGFDDFVWLVLGSVSAVALTAGTLETAASNETRSRERDPQSLGVLERAAALVRGTREAGRERPL
jgi:O-antigen ligase